MTAKRWRVGGPKVLIVAKGLNLGGTERHIVRIVPQLRERGVDASVFVLVRGGRLESELAAAGVSIFGLQSGGAGRANIAPAIWSLYRHMRKHQPDVAHFFLPEPYLIGSIAGMLAGVRARIMSRRSLSYYQAKHPMLARLEWQLHRHTDALIANSSAVLADLARETEDEWRLGLIHNGVIEPQQSSPAEREAARRALDLPQDCFMLAIVANLMAYKGHADLLEALARANSRLPAGWRLFVAGRDDGAGAMLRERTLRLGLGENVIWAGERNDPDNIYAAADVFVLSSHEEGFSNSLIEAMGHGLPVVATAVGGNLDAVVPGESGILVPVRSPDALARAIVDLAGDSALRARLGQAARLRAERLFSLDGCVDRYVNLYRGAGNFGVIPVREIIEHSGETAAAVSENQPVHAG